MVAVTIQNLSDETHRALGARAAYHGRSTEAEFVIFSKPLFVHLAA